MNNMESEMKKFDPSTIMDGVKDKIRLEFANLIPENVWEEMVKQEVNYFFYKKQDEGYSSRRSSTQFQRVCNSLLEEECRKRFKEYLNSSDFQATYKTNGQPIASEAVKKFIVENSGEVLANFFGSMMQSAIHNMQYNM